MKLIERQPKRIFTFGCSFTAYHWATWPEIIASDLDIPLYNYGRSGAGNQYMAQQFAYANAKHKFTEDDLIMVSWTNVCREDRWVDGTWVTPGNIFTQNIYDENWVMRFVDPLGMLIRDLNTISLVKTTLEAIGCQWHFISMVDIARQIDQGDNNNLINGKHSDVLASLLVDHRETLNSITANFYEVLWNNDINKNKFEKEYSIFGNKFNDGHPLPEDHLLFLQRVFDEHNFKNETVGKTRVAQTNLIHDIKRITAKARGLMPIYQFNHNVKVAMEEAATIVKSEESILP